MTSTRSCDEVFQLGAGKASASLFRHVLLGVRPALSLTHPEGIGGGGASVELELQVGFGMRSAAEIEIA